MDFSNSQRALQSLMRRQPPLDDKIIELSTEILLPYFSSDSNNDKSDELLLETKVMPGVMELLGFYETTQRWEPLAVGLFLAMTLLEQFASSAAAGTTAGDKNAGGGAGHYVDGPRLPEITPAGPVLKEAPTTNGAGSTSAVVMPSLSRLLDFTKSIVLGTCQTYLEHDEPRVRTLVARVIGAHARLTTLLMLSQQEDSASVVSQLHEQVLQIYNVIRSSLEEQYQFKRADVGTTDSTTGVLSSPKKMTGLTTEEAKAHRATQIALDDTTGWRALETSLHALGSWYDGYSTFYWTRADADSNITSSPLCMNLLDQTTCGKTLLQIMEECAIKHINRHVRAASLQTMDQLVQSATKAASADQSSPAYQALYSENASEAFLRTSCVKVLVVTLADNWSQVRMAASVLCRSLLESLLNKDGTTDILETQVYPKLLPRMCLNRFYLAQGVKLYSQETWELLFKGEEKGGGISRMAQHAGAVARYYSKMADADNHVVREAACQAIAEVAWKIGRSKEYSEMLEPHVPVLLQALLMCFFDESWPVRDEASLACGTFCRAYPQTCLSELPTLLERWLEQLTDQIWSVREDAALALGDAIVAYKSDVFDTIITKLQSELIDSARNQPAQTKEEMLAKHNDLEAHTNNQMYSCGSLAPKLGRGSARATGGCSDCKMTRDRMPWEATDGSIYMIRELFKLRGGTDAKYSDTPEAQQLVTDDLLKTLFTQLIDVCRVKHFPQADDLRATLFNNVGDMAHSVGKMIWKRHYLSIPGLLELMVDTLESSEKSVDGGNQLAVHAAGKCSSDLAHLVGKTILVGRIEDDRQQAFLENYLNEHMTPQYGGVGMNHGNMSQQQHPLALSSSNGNGGTFMGGTYTTL